MDRFNSDAERLRHHRRCFEYGLAHGMTPKDAEKALRKIDAREGDRAAMARLEAKKAALPMAAPFEQWDAPWMGRK